MTEPVRTPDWLAILTTRRYFLGACLNSGALKHWSGVSSQRHRAVLFNQYTHQLIHSYTHIRYIPLALPATPPRLCVCVWLLLYPEFHTWFVTLRLGVSSLGVFPWLGVVCEALWDHPGLWHLTWNTMELTGSDMVRLKRNRHYKNMNKNIIIKACMNRVNTFLDYSCTL